MPCRGREFQKEKQWFPLKIATIFLKERKLGTFCSLEAFYCNMHEAHCWHTNYISLHNLCWCLSAGKQDKSVSEGPEPLRSFMAASFRFHPASDEAVTIVLGHSSDPLLPTACSDIALLLGTTVSKQASHDTKSLTKVIQAHLFSPNRTVRGGKPYNFKALRRHNGALS